MHPAIKAGNPTTSPATLDSVRYYLVRLDLCTDLSVNQASAGEWWLSREFLVDR